MGRSAARPWRADRPDSPGTAGDNAPVGPVRGRDLDLEERRWSGRPGRIEVWYDTITDPRTGTGFWLHHELCAPSDGREATGYGWVCVFPPDAAPELVRFGPDPLGDSRWFAAGEVVAEPGRRSGRTAEAAWELTYEGGGEALFTFPRVAWRRELLPAAQVVPSPTASFRGAVTVGARRFELDGASGGAAHIYGHGNAERWAWLHADLGGGDVLEIVAAVPRRPGLRRMPPLAFVQLRASPGDWPRHSLVGALRSSARIGLPSWEATARVGSLRLRADVALPPGRCVTVEYRDPDGSPATCTNSECADVEILLERRTGCRWTLERRFALEGTAHAEVGTRP